MSIEKPRPWWDALRSQEQPDMERLEDIGKRIGYGRAQQILGELWDAMLQAEYGVSARGAMGVTIDDDLPPIPKAQATRRVQRENGGYEMVPSYSVAELKEFGHAVLRNHDAEMLAALEAAYEILRWVEGAPGAVLAQVRTAIAKAEANKVTPVFQPAGAPGRNKTVSVSAPPAPALPGEGSGNG